MTVKKHRELKITAKWLRKHGACSEAIAELEAIGILPALVSTDPEANIELCERIVDRSGQNTTTGDSLYVANIAYLADWLCRVCSGYGYEYATSAGRTAAEVSDNAWNHDLPIYIAAQVFAKAADAYFTQRGK